MASSSFDPTGAVRFDLRTGSASDSRGERLVLVPSAALDLLSSEALAKIGEHIGAACGARVASRLGGDSGVRGSDVETVIETALGGAVATQILEGEKTFDLVVRVDPGAVSDQESIRAIPILGPNGEKLTLGSVADVRLAPGSARVYREENSRTFSGARRLRVISDRASWLPSSRKQAGRAAASHRRRTGQWKNSSSCCR